LPFTAWQTLPNQAASRSAAELSAGAGVPAAKPAAAASVAEPQRRFSAAFAATEPAALRFRPLPPVALAFTLDALFLAKGPGAFASHKRLG
jgi:hypothetical protein